MYLDWFPGNENKIFNMDEEAVGAADSIVTEFSTYEDFLDSQITPLDLYYLEVMLFFICGAFWVEFAASLRQIKLVPMPSLNNWDASVLMFSVRFQSFLLRSPYFFSINAMKEFIEWHIPSSCGL